MSVCFTCDTKLDGERTSVCSGIAPHSHKPYRQKISELVGDEVVVIATPVEHMCKECTSLFSHLDKLENNVKLIKYTLLSKLQNKYRIFSPDQAVMGVKVEEQLEQDQRKVPSGPTVGVFPIGTTVSVVTPVEAQLKLLKTQQQQQKKQQQHHQLQQQQPPTQQESVTKKKVYPIFSHPLTSKKKLYRCQTCSETFEIRTQCLDHIHKHHNQKTPLTSNEKSLEDTSVLNQEEADQETPDIVMKEVDEDKQIWKIK